MSKKDKSLDDIHNEAMNEFAKIQSALRDERKQCLQDRRFYSIAGAQWEGPLGDQFEEKPRIEVNKIHLAVIRIINEYRNNRITVNFIPKDGATGSNLSDTCNGLYRADEQDSIAEEAYDNAFEEAVGGGFGAFRLRADYEHEEDEDDDSQKICIEPIFDADSSVFFDLDAKRQDKADAKRCFVLSSMTHQSFIDDYGEDPSTWPKLIHQREFDWLTPDVVYVAEYYVKETTTKTVVTYRGLSGEERKFDKEELDEDKSIVTELKQTGFKKLKDKVVKTKKVHKYLLCGNRILEDYGYIAGCEIPIIPVYGKRWFIDNVERCMGHVRLAKDAQRLKNMQLSKLAEISALSSVEKPILTPEQISGHAEMWSQDNIKNYPYLLINPLTDDNGQIVSAAPMAYTRVPAIPPAMAALLQLTEEDIKDLLGNQQAGEEMQSNISGVAVELIQQKLDMQTYIYISNMAKAVKRAGEIWLGMAKEVYVEEGRKRKTIDEQGEISSVTLMQPNLDPDTGVPVVANNLTKADFDVTAIPGPTSSSKRAATVRKLIELLGVTQDPQTVQVLTSMIMMNLEGEGIEEIRDYFRKKLVASGVIKPTVEEQQELEKEAQAAANQPPDANTQFLMASANQANADAMKKQADTVKVTADAELSKAQTMKILADIKAGNIDQAFRAIEALQNAALVQAQANNHNAQAQATLNPPQPQDNASQPAQ